MLPTETQTKQHLAKITKLDGIALLLAILCSNEIVVSQYHCGFFFSLSLFLSTVASISTSSDGAISLVRSNKTQKITEKKKSIDIDLLVANEIDELSTDLRPTKRKVFY